MKAPGEEMIVPDGWGFAPTVDRREFLKLTGTGILVMIALEPLAAWAQEEDRPKGYPTDVNAYLHIAPDGKITCYVGKIEMGQGVMTSLPQLVAEELDAKLDDVSIVLGDTDLCPWDMGTFGSLSIRHFGPVLRAACAEAKAVLLQLAAERLKVKAGELKVEDGAVVAQGDAKKRVTYGALTEGKRITRKLEGKAALEAAAGFTVVGKSAPRRDAVEKVTGRAMYAGDLVPKGALHAVLLRPPSHGATLVSADTKEAQALPGVRVVREGELIAVLHERRDLAEAALKKVKAVFKPSANKLDDKSIFDHLQQRSPEGEVEASGGDLDAGKKGAKQSFSETYRKGYVAHAAMETHSAVAQVEDGKVTVWAGTQTPFPLKSQVQHALGLPADKVRVITPFVGGGFGGKSASQQAIEAARLAKAAGVPVRVVWSREEEFFFDTFDPAAVIEVHSGLDAAGKIAFWDYVVMGAGSRGAAHFYDIPNHRTLVRGGWRGNPPDLHPFAVGPWRAPGANANAFARESQIDVMAAKAGADPVEFRLKHLSDARMRGVLEAVAKSFGWTPKPGPSGRGFGVALSTDAGTYNATMAEVKVDKASGKVQVVRLVTAQDMGVVVNPEGARQQAEGAMTMGLGYTLAEEVHFKNGVIGDTNFDGYHPPRFSWVPKLETVFVSTPGLAAQGGGEPAIVPMGAVVANAVFDATGARMRQLPMTPERVKAELRARSG